MPSPTSNPQRPRDRIPAADLLARQDTAKDSGPRVGDSHTPKDTDVSDLQSARYGERERLSTENEPVASSTNLKQQPDGPEQNESGQLRAENSELRNIIAELRGLIEDNTVKNRESLAEREKEYEVMLEEKTEIIRQLHAKIQELESRPQAAPYTPPPNEQELLALSDELERERCQLEQERRQLEQERRQLQEDEQSMMQQMREMEVQMARERAEMARQRNELQRLHSDIRHELELASRDATLNERLRLLQRRHQEVVNRSSGTLGSSEPQPQEPPPQQPPPQPSKDSGLFRRLFGQRK